MMKKIILITLLCITIAGGIKSQCPPNALAYTSEYPQCAEGCGVLLRDWPEGALVYIYGGNPLSVINSVQIPGVFGGSGVNNAFVCVPCNIPLVFASTVPGATSGCVIVYLGVLPVSITSFTAGAGNGSGPVIRWTASSDTRDVVYTLQRSTADNAFADVYSINGRGGSVQNYQYVDATSATGNLRYRLKYQDERGSLYYSTVTSVKNGTRGVGGTIYPNPTTGKNFILHVAPETLPATAQLINTQGQLMETRNITNTITEFCNSLRKGVYALRVIDRNHNTHTQILIKE